MNTKELARQRRHARIRKKVLGTAEKPRLSVHRSLSNLYVQIVDDARGHTLVAASTLDKAFENEKKNRGNIVMAKKVGQLLASKAAAMGIKKVVFDRSGYRYHGCVKALADSARENGLEF